MKKNECIHERERKRERDVITTLSHRAVAFTINVTTTMLYMICVFKNETALL